MAKKEAISAGDISAVQEAKRELLDLGEGEVLFKPEAASLALGVDTETIVQRFLKESKGLTVFSEEAGVVTFRLSQTYPERDIWAQLIEKLRESRSEVGQAQDLYGQLFLVCKLIEETRGDTLEDIAVLDQAPADLEAWLDFVKDGGSPSLIDVNDLRAMAAVTFYSLPLGIQEEIKGEGRSPEFLSKN